MPICVFASSKGGSGKSTSSLLLAAELARKATAVTVIDADPNQPINDWAKLPRKPDNITVIADINEENIIDQIEAAAARDPFVIVDLEGTASQTVGYAVALADLVIVPCQGSQLDAKEAAKVIKLVRREERVVRRTIPFSILLTRTPVVARPRTLRHIEGQFETSGIDGFATEINEREAFRAIFSFGGTISTLNADHVRNLGAAAANIRAFAAEVITKLRGIEELNTRVA